MKRALPVMLALMMGCVGEYDEPLHPAGSGGQGQDATGSGGNGSGGSQVGTGGAASGGAVGSGGEVGSGGRPGSGGAQASGGTAGSGGAVGSGGSATGGAVGSGGQSSGGAIGGGGRTGMAGAGVGSGGRGTGGSTGGRTGGSAGGRSGSGGATGSGGAGSGGSTATVCTSGKTWTNGNGTDMRPGNDCRGCHSFSISGTVYPTVHEPNNCDGTAAGGVKIVLTGADGSTVTLTPSATSGNFYSNTAIKTPFTAKITNSSGGTRMMMASQTTANCNSCHTPAGGNGAPGRIYVP